MAKLFYGPDYGTITVRADDDASDLKNEIEVTPEQASAIAASQSVNMLQGIAESLSEISTALSAIGQKG